MARHIMAVCVVCLLCADRIPCQEHFEGIFPATTKTTAGGGGSSSLGYNPADAAAQQHLEYQALNARVYQRTDLNYNNNPSINTYKNPHINEQSIYADGAEQLPKNYRNYKNLDANLIDDKRRHRHKRHAGHEKAANAMEKRPEITDDFLQRLFREYGDGSTIQIGEFQRMLQQLGLKQLLEQKLQTSASEKDNETCISDVALVHHIRPHDLSHHQEHLKQQQSKCNDTLSTCKSQQSQEHDHHHVSTNYSINEQELLNLCPVLLYQIASTSTLERAGCIQNSLLMHIDSNEEKEFAAEKDDIMYVWIYAFISVFACGILGLVGVAIIPFMESRYYKHIIQFLVSLAVGTMTGDALLHLLPHALAGQSESNMIYKGLTCLTGIVFFYMTEHGLTMIAEWRKRISKKDTKTKPHAKVVRDPDSSINNSVAGDKLCKSKYSSYPYCYDEIAMDTKHDVWMHLPHNTSDGTTDTTSSSTQPANAAVGADKRPNGKDANSVNCNHDAHENATAAQSLLSTSHNNYAPISELNHHHQNHNHQHNHNHLHHKHHQLDEQAMGDGVAVNASGAAAAANVNGNGNENGCKDMSLINNETVTVILREHEASHHGHSHIHGHVHSPPESLSAVAWMIIMGDGLHNFTDGMAIGAAFAENIAGGFSTSLAVFCHELPHELGDFAILMKAGMSVKSAVYYNLLTGVLSFIGMIFGIVFGQSQDTAQWMFAAAAGLFIYIALVDMMPELSSAHKTLEQFVLQIAGMASGIMLMLIIAIYEGDLMNVFAAATPAGHVH